MSFGFGRNAVPIRENADDLDLWVAGYEESADCRQEVVNDRVAAARNPGARNRLASRLSTAVRVNQRPQCFQVAGAQCLEELSYQLFGSGLRIDHGLNLALCERMIRILVHACAAVHRCHFGHTMRLDRTARSRG